MIKALIAVFLFIAIALAAEVRVAHASPDAPLVDVYVDNHLIWNSVDFHEVTAYAFLPAGDYNIKVNVAGTQTTVINANVTVDQYRPYTIAAIGKVADIAPLVLTDDLRPPTAGNAAVRFVHLSPDAPAVDIAVTGGPVLFKNVAFKQASDYIQVAAGTYNLEVRVAGTTTVALKVPGVILNSRAINSIFAEGLLAGTGNQALTAIQHWDL
eukprot:TRINITY_DN3362_c0_g1_i1.p1 TRINITY_DN3362_c0_g1~~TRINITY_DN3362_c0_g1_i1.p1  ORF type:complete len:225 (-),score=68.89 TRINITY_DN3362_c0_g1_i1:57-689(-)